MCRLLFAAFAALLAVASPAAAFTFLDGEGRPLTEHRLDSIVELNAPGRYIKLWARIDEGDSFYRLCAHAHGEEYRQGVRPRGHVMDCILRQADVNRVTVDYLEHINPGEQYCVLLTPEELQSVLRARTERCIRCVPEPAPIVPPAIAVPPVVVPDTGLEKRVTELEQRSGRHEDMDRATTNLLSELVEQQGKYHDEFSGRFNRLEPRVDAVEKALETETENRMNADKEAAEARATLKSDLDTLGRRVDSMGSNTPVAPAQNLAFGQVWTWLSTNWVWILVLVVGVLIGVVATRLSGGLRRNPRGNTIPNTAVGPAVIATPPASPVVAPAPQPAPVVPPAPPPPVPADTLTQRVDRLEQRVTKVEGDLGDEQKSRQDDYKELSTKLREILEKVSQPMAPVTPAPSAPPVVASQTPAAPAPQQNGFTVEVVDASGTHHPIRFLHAEPDPRGRQRGVSPWTKNPILHTNALAHAQERYDAEGLPKQA